MIRRPPRSTLSSSSAASDVYKRQLKGFLGMRALGAGTVSRIFDCVDIDNSGVLNYEEYKSFIEKVASLAQTEEEQLNTGANLVSESAEGLTDEDAAALEFVRQLEAEERAKREKKSGEVDEAKTDGSEGEPSSRISPEKLEKLMWRCFDAIDDASSGSITVGDLQKQYKMIYKTLGFERMGVSMQKMSKVLATAKNGLSDADQLDYEKFKDFIQGLNSDMEAMSPRAH
eukprot:TRINITY_DN61115_c0_g1_i1.p1 TRINITY_DN61115_c0_g1~~TRINITY_DN61115_c0_g1_i1.p1  ORF type:complete len:229 (-),score=67.76 TRINITY_DN61115_c0_g1_i1:258-944(-)